MKIYITGASGVGTTTLARAIASSLNIKHIESDDLFCTKTDPPFTKPRDIESLHRNFHDEINSEGFVFAGDILNWGLSREFIEELFSHVIFITLPWETREKR